MDGLNIPKKAATASLSIYYKKVKVTVPHPKNDLPLKTQQSILKQAGLK